VAGDLHHRPHLDAWSLHVENEERDPAVLRRVRIRSREHAAPAGELRPRDPRLLSTERITAGGLDGSRPQRREVGSRLGLREPLAPNLLRREDRRDVAALLLVCAEGEERRAEDVEADDRDELGRARGREFLVDDDLLGRRAAAAAELGRPSAPDVPRLVELCLPAPQVRDALVERVGQLVRLRPMLRQIGANLVAQPLLVG
jgi:hypothetical protein